MTTVTTPVSELVASMDQIRAELDVPIATLASAVGVSKPTMWRLLTGRTAQPDPDVVAKCLIYLGRLMQHRAQS